MTHNVIMFMYAIEINIQWMGFLMLVVSPTYENQ